MPVDMKVEVTCETNMRVSFVVGKTVHKSI